MAKKPAPKTAKPIAAKVEKKPSKTKVPAVEAKAKASKKMAVEVEEADEEILEEVPKAKTPAKSNKKNTNGSQYIEKLDRILEAELSGVVRYLHYSFMIFGPNRIPITKWFRDQATEGTAHAVMIGEKITAFGGHPSVKVQPVPDTKTHNVIELLKESMQFERATLDLYKDLLNDITDDVAFEEMIRGLIEEEVAHIEEVEKMCRK